jgi:hypothetical protein
MKKKWIASSLVLGLVLSAADSTALSFLNLNTRSAYAADLPSQGQSLLDKLNGIHARLLPDELQPVRDAKVRFKAFQPADINLIQEIWAKIKQKKDQYPNPVEVNLINEENVMKLVADFGIFYDPEGIDMETLRISHNRLIGQLAKLGGMTQGLNEIDFSDITDFYLAVENVLKQKLAGMSMQQLLLLGTTSGMADVLKETIRQTLEDQSLDFSKIAIGLGINADDLVAAKNRLVAKADPSSQARIAVTLAYLRMQLTYSESVTANGRVKTPQISILGKTIPNALLTWSKVSGSDAITVENAVSGSDARVMLGAGANSGTATIRASLLGRQLYEGQITLNVQSSSSGGSGGGSSSQPQEDIPEPAETDAVLQQTSRQLDDMLTKLQQDLANMPGARTDLLEKASNQARELVKSAIQKFAVLDLSKVVKVNGSKATVELGEQGAKALSERIGKIREEAGRLNELLKKIDPTAVRVPVELKLNVGTFSEEVNEIVIPKLVFSEAKTAGIDKVAGELNGIIVSMSPIDLLEDTTISIKKQADVLPTIDAFTRQASYIYDIEVSEGGKQQTDFANRLQLRVRVNNPEQFDQELLVLAKMVERNLQVVGGMYDSDQNMVVVERDSLSSYVVIENKVAFKDLQPVQTWAGREIEVTAAKGIIEGRANGVFEPDAEVTRAEFAKMLVKTFVLEDKSASEDFADVQDDDWFKPYVASAAKLGIVNGRTEDRFDPNAYITRAEMAAMTSRTLNLVRQSRFPQDPDAVLQPFKDADAIHPTLREGAALAVSKGLIRGTAPDAFDPNGYATRAQAAVMIYRLLYVK